MVVLVSGVVLLLALITGLASLSFVPKFEKNNSDDSRVLIDDSSPANQLKSFFPKNKSFFFVLTVTALLSAVTVALLYNNGTQWLALCKYVVVLLALFSVMVIDKYTHLIPNAIVLFILGAGAIMYFVEFLLYREQIIVSIITGAAGLIICVVLFYVMGRLTKNGIGMGDIKLIAAMGWILGLSVTMFTVLFALIISCFAAVVLLFRKKKNKNDRIPFGPFLFFGYILLLIFMSI